MKKKLTLDVDALAVQSFAAGAERPARGTVAAHDQQTFTEVTPVHPCEHSGEPCVYTLLTACPPECGV
jgi:hypothetical protein